MSFKDGDWTVPHSLALFEESDVLCVANREGQKIDCMKAGIERPLYANRDETGQKVTSYKGVGRPYAIDGKGIRFFVFFIENSISKQSLFHN